MTHQRYRDFLTNHLLMKSQTAQLISVFNSICKLQQNIMCARVCRPRNSVCFFVVTVVVVVVFGPGWRGVNF